MSRPSSDDHPTPNQAQVLVFGVARSPPPFDTHHHPLIPIHHQPSIPTSCHHPSILTTTTLRNPPATTPNPETSNECSFLSPPPFDTYQLPPPNPETRSIRGGMYLYPRVRVRVGVPAPAGVPVPLPSHWCVRLVRTSFGSNRSVNRKKLEKIDVDRFIPVWSGLFRIMMGKNQSWSRFKSFDGRKTRPDQTSKH